MAVYDNSNFYPYGMLVSGIVLLIAASILCGDELRQCEGDGDKLAVVLGVINSVLAATFIFMHRGSDNLSAKGTLIAAIIMFAIWVFTAGYLTFEGPFLIPGNGYVAAWLGAIFALGLLARCASGSAEDLKARSRGRTAVLMMIAGSVVVAVAGFANDCCEGQQLLAVIAGLSGVVSGVIMLWVGIDKLIAFLTALGWIIAGLILTFGDFELIGNGYLGCWVAMISSLVILSQVARE